MAVLLLIKWLVITAVILAVPFGIWWTIDRSRRPALAVPAPPVMAAPIVTPAIRPARPTAPRATPAAPLPRRPLRTLRPREEPATAPVPVPRQDRRPEPSRRPEPPRQAGPRVLDPDREVVVTREEDHQDVLARHHRPGAAPRPLTVELWSSSVTRGKYRGDYAVEVRLDGERVGELTALMSARYRHLVDVVGPVRCRGVVTHGDRGYQVDLKLPDVV
ncbi:hypothetical protein [Actinomycetospora flava]|uniref:Uncharacterized protein n=1 Tax=Actinomycetospora flava TaxID=3129232 RepID=A0ABU8MCG9_9PSEU